MFNQQLWTQYKIEKVIRPGLTDYFTIAWGRIRAANTEAARTKAIMRFDSIRGCHEALCKEVDSRVK